MSADQENQVTSEYNLNNFTTAQPFLTLKKDLRPFQGVNKPSYTLQILPEGETKPRVFSTMLHGCDLSRVIKDKWGDDMMFASWAEGSPTLPLAKAWSDWIFAFYKLKVLSERDRCVEMGYTNFKENDPNKTIKPPLQYDEKRKVWSIILRPTMSDGISKAGVKFTATKALHRRTKMLFPITDCLQRAGPGVVGRLGVELGGNQGAKRFKIHVYGLLYNKIMDASGDNTEALLNNADALDPLDDEEMDEDELALLNTRVVVDENAGGLVVTGEADPADQDQGEAAPSPDIPTVSATKPLVVQGGLKPLKK